MIEDEMLLCVVDFRNLISAEIELWACRDFQWRVHSNYWQRMCCQIYWSSSSSGPHCSLVFVFIFNLLLMFFFGTPCHSIPFVFLSEPSCPKHFISSLFLCWKQCGDSHAHHPVYKTNTDLLTLPLCQRSVSVPVPHGTSSLSRTWTLSISFFKGWFQCHLPVRWSDSQWQQDSSVCLSKLSCRETSSCQSNTTLRSPSLWFSTAWVFNRSRGHRADTAACKAEVHNAASPLPPFHLPPPPDHSCWEREQGRGERMFVYLFVWVSGWECVHVPCN